MARLLSVALLLSVAFHVRAQSHCSPSEVDYFSCQIEHSSKVVSLCGGRLADIRMLSRRHAAWLQYRFGQLGKMELVYPPETTQSIEAFTPELHAGVQQVSFETRGATYFVASVQGEVSSFSGVSVVTRSGKSVSLRCGRSSRSAQPGDFYDLVHAIAYPSAE